MLKHIDGDIYFGAAPNYIDPRIDRASLYLRREEKLLSARQIPVPQVSYPLSSVEALLQLTHSEQLEDVGKNGPTIASGFYPEHGTIPELQLYGVVFGRDALIVASFLCHLFPVLARQTVQRLAELQGVTTNIWNEEEPGRIVHEARDKDSLLAQQLTARYQWQWPYYASVDATPLFIQIVAEYALNHDPDVLAYEYTARDGKRSTMTQALLSALKWIYGRLDQNKEGLLESKRMNKAGGTVNQMWKDAYDSYHHHDGTFANREAGVASIEVQALVYDAFLDMIELFNNPKTRSFFTEKDSSFHQEHCQKRSAKLKKLIMQRFWIEDERGGYFALGSDRDKTGKLQILKVRASNMGHVLQSRLLDGESMEIQMYKEMLVKTLFSEDMLNVSGIRTLSTRENRFRPHAYHNGSVWPWDTYYISLGLLRQGYISQAQELWRRIKNVFTVTHCFPEFVSGAASETPVLPNRAVKVYDTKYDFEHFIEQPPQYIQAWSVAAAIDLERRLTGG